jgi:hypothetical protein
MSIFWIILIIIAAYFFLVFFVLRLVAPFMGFKQYQPPKDLPVEAKQTIAELENGSADSKAYLKAAYDFTQSRWHATRGEALTQLVKLFREDFVSLWRQPGYAHCTTQNFILHTLLANSKFFKPQDIIVRHVFLNFVPHQYLRVRVGEQWVDVDPAAGSALGIPFGRHGSFFG